MKLAETKRYIAFFVTTCHTPIRVQLVRIYDKYAHRSRKEIIRRYDNNLCVVTLSKQDGVKQNIVGTSVKEVLTEYQLFKRKAK